LEIAELNELLPAVFSEDTNNVSMWRLANLAAASAEEIPLFQTMFLTQKAGQDVGAIMKVLDKSVKDLDPNGECTEPAPKEEPGVNPALGSLPTVVGLSGERANSVANSGNAAASEPVTPTLPESCAPVVARRKMILAATKELGGFVKSVGGVISGSIQIRVAPLRVKRATDELSRSEASIRLIRRVLKATGLE
jgi:hypothetical protein